jgi:hypothetical protein
MGDQSKMMVGQPPTIHLRVVNTGQTPARNVVIWNRAEIFATYPPPVLDWSRPKENIEGKSIHGRGDDAIMIRRETPVRPQGVPITPDEEAEMKAGTKEFHGWGEIIYEDVFEREWFTKFHVTFGGPDSYTLKRLRTPYEGNEST